MRKLILIISGIAALALVLAGAAFVGGQLFRQQQQAQASSNLQTLPRKLVTPAAGLPTTAPDGSGDATRKEGNSIFICEPSNSLSLNPDGTVNKDVGCAGPEFEVVVGHDTIIYHDITARQYPNVRPTPGQDIVLTQAIEPGTADDIGQGTAVRAWGQRAGNRIIAHILLYWNRTPSPSSTPGS